jgi:Putative auto-transporter adhesin, head GIN domain
MMFAALILAGLAPFSAVDAAGDVIVEISARGADASFEETTGSGEGKLEVKDRTLFITGPPSTKRELKVRVVAPNLNQVRARFSARVTVKDLDAKTLEASAADSAHLTLLGKVATLSLFGTGSARLDADALENTDARVVLERAARASAAPTGSLDVDMKGATVLEIKTKPRRISKKLAPASRLKLP